MKQKKVSFRDDVKIIQKLLNVNIVSIYEPLKEIGCFSEFKLKICLVTLHSGIFGGNTL